MVCGICHYIEPRHNGTWLYKDVRLCSWLVTANQRGPLYTAICLALLQDGTMDHLSQHIRQLIDRARRVQEIYEERIFSTVSTNVAVDSAIITLAEMNQAYNEKRRASIASLADSSDMDSFVSATDVSPGLILGSCPANERRRYKVTTSLIGWAQT